MTAEFSEIFLGWHLRQLVQTDRRLREQLDNHHQGSADGYGS